MTDAHIPTDPVSHSAGPWKIDWTIAGGGRNEDFPELHYANISSQGYMNGAPVGLSITGYIRKADAHLLAAAPDLFEVLNQLHGEFDQQTHLEMSRLDNDPPDDAEFSVNITAKQLRAINEAILRAEGKKP